MSNFRHKTTFVLGAGASVPYGYPTGHELNRLIRLASKKTIDQRSDKSEILLMENGHFINLKETPTNNAFYYEMNQLINVTSNDGKHIDNFHNQFKGAAMNSIDEFLIRFPEYETLGKLLICQRIKRCENRIKLFDNEDWYSILWRMVNSSDEIKMKENFMMINFITFNYDRSFEIYLYNNLFHYFKQNKQKTDIFFEENIKIVHVYGRISDFTFLFNKKSNGPFVEYGHFFRNYDYMQINYFREFAENINLIGSRCNNKDVDQIRISISNAQKVIFLGFGFDDTNMSLLDVPTNKRIEGTCLGLPFFVRRKIETSFHSIKLNECNIYEFLHKHFVF